MSKTVTVRADDEPSVKAKEIEDALKAGKARRDAEGDERFQKLCDAVEGLHKGMGTLMDRMDAYEAKKKADADLEDVEELGDPEPSFDDTDPRDGMDPNHALADAQHRADQACNAWGLSAPPPMAGERLLAYRKRLLRPLQKYSATFKDADLNVASVDKSTFDAIEGTIYADAIAASRSPDVAEGRLIERTITKGGHTFTEFHGDPRVWLNTAGNYHTGNAVVGFGPAK